MFVYTDMHYSSHEYDSLQHDHGSVTSIDETSRVMRGETRWGGKSVRSEFITDLTNEADMGQFIENLREAPLINDTRDSKISLSNLREQFNNTSEKALPEMHTKAEDLDIQMIDQSNDEIIECIEFSSVPLDTLKTTTDYSDKNTNLDTSYVDGEAYLESLADGNDTANGTTAKNNEKEELATTPAANDQALKNTTNNNATLKYKQRKSIDNSIDHSSYSIPEVILEENVAVDDSIITADLRSLPKPSRQTAIDDKLLGVSDYTRQVLNEIVRPSINSSLAPPPKLSSTSNVKDSNIQMSVLQRPNNHSVVPCYEGVYANEFVSSASHMLSVSQMTQESFGDVRRYVSQDIILSHSFSC